MGIFDGFNNSIDFIKDTLNLMSKNAVLLEGVKRSILITFGCVFVLALIFGFSIIFPPFIIIAVVLLIAALFALPFVGNYYASAHSYLVYKIAKGEKPEFQEGSKRAWENFSDITYLTFVEIVVNAIIAQLRSNRQEGLFGIILRLIFSGIAKLLEEGFDLFRNFIIPAMIITDRDIWGSIDDLKKLKDRIVESLVGVLGFDFVSGAVNSILALVGVLLIVAFAFLGFISLGPIGLFVLGGLGFLLLILAMGIVSQLFSFAKTTYFTLLWIELNEPSVLKKNPELAAYLLKSKARVAKASAGKKLK